MRVVHLSEVSAKGDFTVHNIHCKNVGIADFLINGPFNFFGTEKWLDGLN